MIYDINDLDKETIALLNSELEVRYFIPEITAITSNRRKQGYIFWDLETKSGKASIVMNNPYSNLKVLENGSVLVYDMDGRCFSIPDPQKLDHQSHKILSEYLF